MVLPVTSHYSNSIARFVAMFALLGAGYYLTVRAQQELSKGIQLERWTDDQLHSLRKFSESWPAKIILAVLIAGMVFFLANPLSRHHSTSAGFWALFVLCNGLTSLQRSLAAPKPSQPASWLQSAAPLQSEHWGDPT